MVYLAKLFSPDLNAVWVEDLALLKVISFSSFFASSLTRYLVYMVSCASAEDLRSFAFRFVVIELVRAESNF